MTDADKNIQDAKQRMDEFLQRQKQSRNNTHAFFAEIFGQKQLAKNLRNLN